MKIWAPSTNDGHKDGGPVGSETGIDERTGGSPSEGGDTQGIEATIRAKVTTNMTYHGGPNTTLQMDCYVIFAGDEWNTNSTWKTNRDNIMIQIKALFTSRYFDWLLQYTTNGVGIKRPVLKNGTSPATETTYKFPDNYNNTTDVKAAIDAAIAASLVPAGSKTKQNLAYIVFPTPDRHYITGTEQGLHNGIAFTDDATLFQYVYCAVNTFQTFANWSGSLCHHLIEMLSDNKPHLGWDNKSGSSIAGTAAGDEMAKVCMAGGTGWIQPPGATYQVAKYWSDVDGVCINPYLISQNFASCPTGYCWSEKQQICLRNPTIPIPTPIPTPTPSPTVTPTVTPTGTPTPTPTPQPGGVDIEGIQMLYQDDPKKASQTFFLSRDGPNGPRVSGKGARKLNSDGTVTVSPDPGTNPASARIYILTTNTADAQNITAQLVHGHDWTGMLNLVDSDGVKRGGWMNDNFDWRDVEFTHYYKITKLSTDDEMTQYLGGNHPSGGFPDQCVSSCYKAQVQTQDLSPRAAIEWDHFDSPSDYAWNDTVSPAFNLKSELGGTIQGKLLGQKWVRYNEIGSDGLLKKVHMELYLDTASKDLPKPDLTKQNWRLFAEYVHDGTNWPSGPAHTDYKSACNASSVKMPAWGAPILAIRFDSSNWTLYALSARPIIPIRLAASVSQSPIGHLQTGTTLGTASSTPDACANEGLPIPEDGSGTTAVTPPPTGPPTGGNINPDGVLQIYDSEAGATRWFINMAAANDPHDEHFNISYGSGSHFPSTKHTEAGITYFNSAGAKQTYNSGAPDSRSCRFDNYPGLGQYNNNTSYSWKSNPGYLYNTQGLMNKEITIYVRPHGQLKTHESCAFKLQGRENDDIRSNIEIVYPNATHPVVVVNYEYSHFPYVEEPNIKQLFTGDKLTDGHWVGVKAILQIPNDKKYVYLGMWADLTPFKADGTPSNTWQLKAECIGRGCKEYNMVIPAWKCHKDVLRLDGFANVDYCLYSDVGITNTNIKTTI